MIYQIYPRSFADGNGDGTGDLAGVRSRLPLPAGPRRRCHLVHALVPLAHGRRRLRRRRLPRHRPDVRRPGRGRGAHRRRPGVRHPDHHRRRPQPRVRRPRLVPGCVGGRARVARARPVLVPGRPRPGRRRAPELAGSSEFGGPTWTRAAGPRRRRPASGTSTSSPPASPTSTGATRTSAASTRTILRFWFDRGVAGIRIDSAALLVKDADAPRGRGTPGAGRPPRTSTATSCTTSTVAGARLPSPTVADRALDRRDLAAGRGAVRPVPAPRRLHTRVQLRLHGRALGCRRAARLDRPDRWPPTTRSAPRPPGCCPTTTSPARSRGMAGRTPSFAFDRQAVRHAHRPGQGRPAHAGRGAARDGAAGRLLPLPG